MGGMRYQVGRPETAGILRAGSRTNAGAGQAYRERGGYRGAGGPGEVRCRWCSGSHRLLAPAYPILVRARARPRARTRIG